METNTFDENKNNDLYESYEDDIKESTESTKYIVDNYDSFEDLELKDNLLRGLYSYGFETPSAIQRRAIKPMIDGKDIVAQAQSGTGKTGAFSTGALQVIDENISECQALIIAPTRELANQISYVSNALSNHMEKISIALCVGGTSLYESKDKIKDGAQLIIGTPGRIIKMISMNIIPTRFIKMMILDEADELLSHSFMPQIREVVQSLPESCQICLYSATMPKDKFEITRRFLRDPVNILVKRENLTLEGISQFFVDVDREEWKLETLCDLYNTISISQSIIYVNTKKRVDWLSDQLRDRDFPVGIIHSDLTPVDRTRIMSDFRHGTTRILISTDLLARGIDVQQVSIVVNYDIPNNRESYIHRIGRSGRYGRKGLAINFVTRRESMLLKDIEQFYETEIKPMPQDIQGYITLTYN